MGRNADIVSHYKRSKSLRVTARKYGLTHERIRQVYLDSKPRERINGFVPSTRLRNVVTRATKAELPDAPLAERLRLFLSKYSFEAMADVPNCGEKTVAEIKRIADTLGEKP